MSSQSANNTSHNDNNDSTASTPSESTSTLVVRPVPHEFAAHLHYTTGLSPWYACRDCLGINTDTNLDTASIEAIEATFTYDDRRWTATLAPKESDFTPEQVDPSLTSIPEFVISIKRTDYDGNAPPKATYQVSPRTPDTPGPEWTGINVAVNGSNLAPQVYPQLLNAATWALGIDADLSSEVVAETSPITVAEYYVRVRESDVRVLYGDDGPIRRISQHVATTSDYRRLVEDRRDDRSYYGTVGFDMRGAASLIDGHRLGKVVKLYDGATPPEDEEHPLHHPKLCVRYEHGQTDDGVQWNDLDVVKRELQETLINILEWSGISSMPASNAASAGRSSFVGDEHFDATASIDPTERDIQVIEDPLPSIRRTQRNSVDMAYADATPAERNALQAIADGGYATEPGGPGMHYKKIAEHAECSESTVYRLLDTFDGLRNQAGRIKLVSHTVADQLQSWVGRGDEDMDDGQPQSAESGAQSSAENAADQSENAHDSTEIPPSTCVSPWKEWKDEHGVTERPDYKRIAKKGRRKGPAEWKKIDLGELPAGFDGDDLRQYVEEGFEAWDASDRPENSYRAARFVWREYGKDEPDEDIGMKLWGIQLEPDRDS